MGVLDGNPKHEPMHYGEIFTLWESSMAAKMILSCYQLFTYHAGDKDLKEILKDLMDQAKLEIKELDKLLMDNGITPPRCCRNGRKQSWRISRQALDLPMRKSGRRLPWIPPLH